MALVVSLAVYGLVPYAAIASTPATVTLSPHAEVDPGPTRTDLCASGVEVPGLGAAPGSGIPCPETATADPAGELCLLPGLADMCPGLAPPGVWVGPTRDAVDSQEDEAPASPEQTSPVDAGEWTAVESPNASAEPNVLTGVACPTPSECWAVGRSRSGLGSTLTMRWDGSSWETFPSPNVEGAWAHILADVACVSKTDCWAVGAYVTTSLQVRTLIMRWDGAEWRIVNSPDSGPTPWNGFNSVTCVSSSECWAVGFDTDGTAKTLIARWDGHTWKVHDSPNAGTQSNLLHGISCTAASECWAVGSFSNDGIAKHTLALHWDGSAWQVVASADAPAAQESVLSGVTCLEISDCWAVGHSYNGATRQTLVARWDGAAWTTSLSPNALGPLDTYLSNVACASTTECWAVGHSNDSTTIDQHYIVRWDGTAWTPATLPDPLGTEETSLDDVSCSGAGCWAVGSATNGTARSLLTRWDGTSWSAVPAPKVSPVEEDHGYLHDVTCVSASDCWAVGFYFSGQVARGLTMHWDGEVWEIVDSPNSAPNRNNYLGSVTCTSSADCWAVGRHTTTSDTARQPLILRWDGASWSVEDSLQVDTSAALSTALESVSCASASECMAVGHANVDGNRYAAFAMSWDGTSWSVVPVPLREDAETFYVPSDLLYDVSCPAPSVCWAAGAHWTGTVYRTLVEHWDGTTWRPVVSPNTTPDRGDILSQVTCVSSADCWAVGSSHDYEQALIEHWDGVSWSIVPSPQTGSILSAVTCVSASDCWAAGPYYTVHPPARTLLVRWDGTSWTKAVSPNPSATKANNLTGIACATSSECWSVGQHFAAGRPQTLTLRYALKGTRPDIAEVALTASSATSGQYSDQTHFEARLAGSHGETLEGEALTFVLTGDGTTRELSATTDEDGIAAVTPKLSERPGAYRITVRFAGNDAHQAAVAVSDFSIEKEDAAVDPDVKGQGNSKTLTARLTDLDSPAEGIAGRTIEFYAGSELIGSATTDTNGVAALMVPPAQRGNRTYEAAFAGDRFFLAARSGTR